MIMQAVGRGEIKTVGRLKMKRFFLVVDTTVSGAYTLGFPIYYPWSSRVTIRFSHQEGKTREFSSHFLSTNSMDCNH
jgi:hypothetical protein